jgi:hypothetical protein
MGFEDERALEGLFSVEATERAAYRLADAGTEHFHHAIVDLTPVSHDPFRQDPRPAGTLRRSWYRVRMPLGDAPAGEMRAGLMRRGAAAATVWRGTIATDDRTVLFVEEDTRPHRIEPGMLREVEGRKVQFDRGAASVLGTRQARGTRADGRARLSWVGPGGRVFARYVNHPGTTGAHMQKRAAIITERQVDRWSAGPLAWWRANVTNNGGV